MLLFLDITKSEGDDGVRSKILKSCAQTFVV